MPLYRDLLSSMPMALNLFAEASFPGNHVSRQALAMVLGVAADGPRNRLRVVTSASKRQIHP